MKIKSAKAFRHWYKNNVRNISDIDDTRDENFIGHSFDDPDKGHRVFGFFDMYHGDKMKIRNFLDTVLEIAEDDQSIFEFLQNAVDCHSTHFYCFYDENYFLAINNGEAFERNGLKAILNIGQSEKQSDSQIGRLGVGFKLVHRLVGAISGAEEIINDYKGPVLFSWKTAGDFVQLLKDTEYVYDTNTDDASVAPLLLKILMTNFPADPLETVYDIDHNPFVPFGAEELSEMKAFVNKSLAEQEDFLDIFNHGSMFFIKLGDGKYDLLKECEKSLIEGIQFSMNTLDKLDSIYINGKQINKVPLKMEQGTILKSTELFAAINPKDKDYDIRYSIGYYADIDFENNDVEQEIAELKSAPNFYKFFPMGDERHGLSLFIHCNSFSNLSSRRKLENNTINRSIMAELAEFLKRKLEGYKVIDRDSFLQLYANLLLSDSPLDNSPWLKKVFYDPIQDYMTSHLPIKNGFAREVSSVKIPKTALSINLPELGLSQYHWFEWHCDKLTGRAKGRLGVREWQITDIFAEAEIEALNKWIASLDEENYLLLIEELNKQLTSTKMDRLLDKIRRIALIRFSDGHFYSFRDIVRKNDHEGSGAVFCHKDNKIYLSDNIESAAPALANLGFITSEIVISKFRNIQQYLYTFKIDEYKRILKQNKIFCNGYIAKLDQSHYEILRNALGLTFGLHLPEFYFLEELKTCLPLLEDNAKLSLYEPFTGDYINALEESEVLSIIDFCQHNRENFFELFTIAEIDKDKYYIYRHTENCLQVYVKGKQREYVDQFIMFYHLPKAFCTDEIKEMEGIVKDEELQLKLIKLMKHEGVTDAFIGSLDSKGLLDYVRSTEVIRIDLDRQYTKTSAEFKIVECICNQIKKNKLNECHLNDIRDKFIIIKDDEAYELTTDLIGESNTVWVGEHHYAMDSLFPNIDSSGSILDGLIDTFTDLGLERVLVEKLLKVTEDPSADDVYRRLGLLYPCLENRVQIWFAVAYSIENQLEEEDCLWVMNHYGDRKRLYTMYIEDSPLFIDRESVLSEDYDVYAAPFIEYQCYLNNDIRLSDNEFCCDHIKSNLDDDEKKELLGSLFLLWHENRELFQDGVEDAIYESDHNQRYISDFFGLASTMDCYHFPNRYTLPIEELPRVIIDWCEDDDQLRAFLHAFGVGHEDDPDFIIRAFLVGDRNRCSSDLIEVCSVLELHKIMAFLMRNNPIITDAKRWSYIEEIVECLDDEKLTVRSLSLDLAKLSEAEEYADDYSISEWAEGEGYGIKTIDGPMPMTASVWREGKKICSYQCVQDDYAVYGQTIFLNKNKDVNVLLKKLVVDSRYVLPHEMQNLDQIELKRLKKDNKLLSDLLDEAYLEIHQLKSRIAELEEVRQK